ncbi:MAG: hypothetical protein A2X64_07435 [Ignavibacteria bacterium GWF2_33_9]|nr:MAG: hypothetical protein A2X64_07435 [Ignavibacteria bacterium GWF2_33_9]
MREAKRKGLRITCEVTPHHFALNEQVLCNFDTNHKMNPPLRKDEDILAIKEGLKDGTVDCIATDHAPHAKHEKNVDFHDAPNGILGLETAVGLAITKLVYDNYLTLEGLIEKLAINPRKVLGLNLVRIEEGEKANLTIFDPNENWVVNPKLFKSKSENSPFANWELIGKVKYTINNNKIYKSVL